MTERKNEPHSSLSSSSKLIFWRVILAYPFPLPMGAFFPSMKFLAYTLKKSKNRWSFGFSNLRGFKSMTKLCSTFEVFALLDFSSSKSNELLKSDSVSSYICFAFDFARLSIKI